MKLFSCQSCQQLLFFESVQCMKCGHALVFLPDRGVVAAVEPAGAATPGLWAVAGDPSVRYRLCRNYTEYGVCNWAVPAGDPHEYCRACRLNGVIPNLATPNAKEAWHRLEIAKRRVLYTVIELGLPIEPRAERPGGLQFDFLQDFPSGDTPAPHVFTGHSDGIITMNIAEADDPFRERVRVQMGEINRTVLGHFRHEMGHYYWNRLVGAPRLAEFRARFGDERGDYAAAQRRHYGAGAPADWRLHFVSAYASMHPWEDWAETWAHYLHIVDTLETACACSLWPHPVKEATSPQEPVASARRLDLHSFDELIGGWLPLTIALNSLTRSMGIKDYYPLVLSQTAIDKLRFVHETVQIGSTSVA